MAASGQKKQLALDTNLLLDLAEGSDFAHDFRETFQAAGYTLLISPTVVQELVFARKYGKPPIKQEWAGKALHELLSNGIHPFDLSPVEHGIAEQFAVRLIQKRLLPEGEFNDGLILAEASLHGVPLLVSSDKHLLNLEETALKKSFEEADLEPVSPANPKRLLKALRS